MTRPGLRTVSVQMQAAMRRLSTDDSFALQRLFEGESGIWLDTNTPPPNWLSLFSAMAPDIAICLPTRVAANAQTSHHIAHGIAARLSLPGEPAQILITVLHEALRNAVIHGNMGMGSQSRTDLNAFEEFEADIMRRVQDDRQGLRPIMVGLKDLGESFEVFVRDDGDGFAPKTNPAADHLGYGRGLAIIRALTQIVSTSHNGRLIMMRIGRC